jgi:hypothetical protein
MTSGDGLPEPVRRYLEHAVPSGDAGVPGVRLTMSGRIKVGIWLPFTATQQCDGKSFLWRASVGLGALRPLEVTDRYEDARGSMTGKLFGRWTLFEQTDANIVRSAAARAALEALFAPRSLLPGRGYAWRAEGDDHIVAIAPLLQCRVWDRAPSAPSRTASMNAKRCGARSNSSSSSLRRPSPAQTARVNTRIGLDPERALGHDQSRSPHPDPAPSHGDLDPAGPPERVPLLDSGSDAIGRVAQGDQ